MKRLLIIPLCLVVFMLCTAESCKEKKGNKLVKKLLSTWTIESLVLKTNEIDPGIEFISKGTTDASKIKSLRIDFDKYLAQHGDLFWFATYGDDHQEKVEGRYEISADSKKIAITLYLDDPTTELKILPNLKTKTYFYFEAPTDDINKETFTIESNPPYEDDKTIKLVGKKF
jgi:hypothetical protein